MNGQQAVTEVFNTLTGADLGIRLFRNGKSSGFAQEYIVVGQGTFTREKNMAGGIVTLEIHVPDTETGEPASDRIQAVANLVEPLFNETLINGAYYSVYDDSFAAGEDGTHYQNMRIQVTFLTI